MGIDAEGSREVAGGQSGVIGWSAGDDLLQIDSLKMKPHAGDRSTQRRIPDAVVCRVRSDPELRWPSTSDEGRSVTVCQRGAVRVIVGDDGESIVTVMWVHSRTGGSDPSASQAEYLLKEVLA